MRVITENGPKYEISGSPTGDVITFDKDSEQGRNVAKQIAQGMPVNEILLQLKCNWGEW